MTKKKYISAALCLLLLCLFATVVGCTPPHNTAADGQEMTKGQFIIQTVWFGVMAVFVYYMLIIKPTTAKQDSHEKFIKALKKNDPVVTSGGILGRVNAVKSDHVVVDIAPNIHVKVLPGNLKARNIAPNTKTKGDAGSSLQKEQKSNSKKLKRVSKET